VEKALDSYVESCRKKKIDPTGVRARTLAKLAKQSGPAMGVLLAEYRARGGGRYVLGCEGYGTSARWQILSKPGDDPAAVQAARLRHARWIATDSQDRWVRDLRREVAPSMKGATWEAEMSEELDDYRAATALALDRLVRRVVRITADEGL
jgi:hypothetical protein